VAEVKSLRDELAADQGKPTQCAVCRWLGRQDDKTAAEWRGVFADRSFTAASIHRALIRREAAVGRSSVESHRTNGHA
jgi:hypothetical protein